MAEDLNIGKVPVESSAVFMCDLQDKFRPAMLHFTEVIANAKKLVNFFLEHIKHYLIQFN